MESEAHPRSTAQAARSRITHHLRSAQAPRTAGPSVATASDDVVTGVHTLQPRTLGVEIHYAF